MLAEVIRAAAELAFAKSMGWDDWTWDEEAEAGMVRGVRVQWHGDPNAILIVYGEDGEDTPYVLVVQRADLQDPRLDHRGRGEEEGVQIGEG